MRDQSTRVPIAYSKADVLDPRMSQTLLSGLNELLNNLHAPDPRNQASQDGSLVAQACADLEHVIAWLRVEKSVMSATMNGCEIVLSKPIGRGMSL